MWRGDDWRWQHHTAQYRPIRVVWPRRPPPVPYSRPLLTPHAAPRIFPPPPPLSTPSLYQDFNQPDQPSSLRMSVTKSAIRCVISWDRQSAALRRLYRLEYWTENGDEDDASSTIIDLDVNTTSHEIDTIPGNWYTAEVSCLDANGRVMAFGRAQFKAGWLSLMEKVLCSVFSYEEMKRLHQRAVDFVGNSMHPFRVLYRCKPQPYFDDIHIRCAGIMERYEKDENGQAASPINGAIEGLFFSARLLPDGSLPGQSPFGDVRMLVPATTLLDMRRMHMYFCDFYCNYLTHYVTVCICVRGSDTDRFCQLRLIRLNPLNNCFLRVVPGPMQTEFWVSKNVWIEIYYTENVPLAFGKFDRIIATGAGTSRIGGLPHNKNCLQCNLYPGRGQPRPVDGDKEMSTSCNSTFQLVLNLIGCERDVKESTDLIETVCTLVDAVVEQKLQQQEIEHPRQVIARLRSTISLPASLHLLNALSVVVEKLEMSCEQLSSLISMSVL